MGDSSAASSHYDLVVRLFHGRGFPSPSGLERDAYPICVVGRFNGETLRSPPAEYSIAPRCLTDLIWSFGPGKLDSIRQQRAKIRVEVEDIPPKEQRKITGKTFGFLVLDPLLFFEQPLDAPQWLKLRGAPKNSSPELLVSISVLQVDSPAEQQ